MIDKTLAGKEITKSHNFLGEAIGVIKLDNNYRNKFIKILKKYLSKKENFKKNWEKPLNEFMQNCDLDYLGLKLILEIDDKKVFVKLSIIHDLQKVY